MEHVEGENLASLLRRVGRLPKDRAITIALEICRGLEAAHERGILHRDLKPSNLMIDANGQAKIMDFGLARFSGSPQQPGEIAGTPDYMAPEQRRGESSVRTEVYALGLVLYELFTGRKARRELVGDDSADSSSVLAMVFDDLDPIVERVIRHCVERDPGLRPSSVGAVSAALLKLTVPAWQPAQGVAIPHRKHWVSSASWAEVASARRGSPSTGKHTIGESSNSATMLASSTRFSARSHYSASCGKLSAAVTTSPRSLTGSWMNRLTSLSQSLPVASISRSGSEKRAASPRLLSAIVSRSSGRSP